MRHIAFLILNLAVFIATPAHFSFAQAYFEVGFKGSPDKFVIKLVKEDQIAHARMILRKEPTAKTHILGTIVKSRAIYNARWGFYLEPTSIGFFENITAICDASPQYIENNLVSIGSDILPKSLWCPLSSQLSREVLIRHL
ncbi:MAG: calmodulin [Myxococcota bacterium]